MIDLRWVRKAVSLAAVLAASSAWAETFQYVQPAALDQPRINAFLRLPGATDPLSFEGVYSVQAFFDTGASGVLLSMNTAGYLGITEQTYTLLNPSTQQALSGTVIFSDVGVAGTDNFYVSQPLEIGLAPYDPNVSDEPPAGIDPLDYYAVHASPIRTQIGPAGQDVEDPTYAILGDLDVFGTPLMRGKVVVMDPKPVDSFFDTMRTYVYDRTTGQSGAVQQLGPGIPAVSRHVKLSKASFEQFTTVTPSPANLPPGADSSYVPVDGQNNPVPWSGYAPTLTDNPFIGPNPLVPGDTSAPPVILNHNGIDRPASLLLDTGAAASMISVALAEQLGITYNPNAPDDSPELLGVPLDQQFSLTVGGIGGTKKMVGFFLDALRLPTQEAIDQNDPTLNIDFAGAPVLVGDITVMNPTTGQPFTLDGIFGMNFLVASAFISEGAEGELPIFGALQGGNFDLITYDHDAGILGLAPLVMTIEPGVVTWKGNILDSIFGLPSSWDIGLSPNFKSGNQNSGYSDGDRVTFNDNPEGFTTLVQIDEPVAPGAVYFVNEYLDYVITGEAIRGYTGVTKTGAGPLIFENSNTFKGIFDIRGGEVTLRAPQDIGPVNVQDAALIMETSQRFEQLNIGSGGEATLAGGGDAVLIVGDLTILGTGVLDMADGLLVIESADPAHAAAAAGRIEQYIADAGLFSSTQAGPGKVMALIPLSQADPSAMAGRFGPDWMAGIDTLFSTPLVALTADLADLNVDGMLDGDDYFLMDRGFTARSTAYAGGDLNFDNIVDGEDYRIMDLLFLQQSEPVAPASSVPEPASALLAAAAGLLLARRRVTPVCRPQDRSRQ